MCLTRQHRLHVVRCSLTCPLMRPRRLDSIQAWGADVRLIAFLLVCSLQHDDAFPQNRDSDSVSLCSSGGGAEEPMVLCPLD
jgi:hypothetical protein